MSDAYPGDSKMSSDAYPSDSKMAPDADTHQPDAYTQQPGAHTHQSDVDPQQPAVYPRDPDAYPRQREVHIQEPDVHPYQPDTYPQQPDSYPPNAYPPEPKMPIETHLNESEATTSAAPTFPDPTHEKAHDDEYGYHDTSTRPSTDSRVSLDEPIADNLPEADHPTVALLIPFPTLLRPPSKKDAKVLPFLMYAPLAAPLPPPKEGDKQSWKNKAIRKWQKEETEAREKKTGLKAKAVGVRGGMRSQCMGAYYSDVAHLEGHVCDEKLADRVPSADTKQEEA